MDNNKIKAGMPVQLTEQEYKDSMYLCTIVKDIMLRGKLSFTESLRLVASLNRK
jgi:hypothetical protein